MSSRAWKQHIAKVTTDGRDVPLFHIDCPAAKTEEKAILLLSHDFPETSYQYCYVLKSFFEAGYRLIVLDIECHGASSHPPYGYTKSKLAEDFYHLLQYHLHITKPIYIVGYDLGGMIAHAFAVWCPSYVKALIWGKCPVCSHGVKV